MSVEKLIAGSEGIFFLNFSYNIKMKIDCGKICVYSHSVNGKVFYVGKGRAQRPYEIRGRADLWSDIVNSAGSFEVDVIEWFATETDALAFEKRLIRELQPTANLIHTTK